MQEVKVEELDYWGWECPECKHWNETQDDPQYESTVECVNCEEHFLVSN